MPNQKHIAVVGAGLVGSLLSIYLIKRGYQVSVFERRADMRKGQAEAGRSINLALSTRGIRALEQVGLAEELKKITVPMHGRMMHDLQGNLTFQPYGKEGQFINSISRSALNIALMDTAEKAGVKFFFDHRCTRFDLAQTQISFTSSTAKTNIQPQSFDLVIGADGAFSAVRGAMQITDRFDFSQHYIEHGYKELHIPAEAGAVLEKNALHIWPRESFMMIALPNADGSFTCTLFFPFEGKPSFASLKSNEEVSAFFKEVFPDAVKLMPGLQDDFSNNPAASLVTIKCYPWAINKTLLIGDAAHGIVPFYGQGMNAGFEDCRILSELLDQYHDNWDHTLSSFQQLRKPDTDAIAQLALDNFVEMRDLVGEADFLLRKKIEARLHELYPDRWVPLYSMVTFYDNIRYSEAFNTGQKQKKIMDDVMQTKGIAENWRALDFEEIINKL